MRVAVYSRPMIMGSVVGCTILLCGCSALQSALPTKGDLQDLQRAASGALHQLPDQIDATVELTKDSFQKAKDTAADVADRAQKVSDGVKKIQEGKALIDQGFAHDSSVSSMATSSAGSASSK